MKRTEVKNLFNRNKLSFLLLSKAGGEGLDLEGTGKVYILEPAWNKNSDEQVIGRAIRYKSHVMFPPEKRYVEVIRLILKKPKKLDDVDQIPESADEMLFKLAYTTKQPVLDSFVNEIKKVSLDQIDCDSFTPEEERKLIAEIYKSSSLNKNFPMEEAYAKKKELFHLF